MSLLSNLEKRLEKLVEGAFSRTPTRVEPMDIARFLRKEMRDGRRPGTDGDFCPNIYLIALSKSDHDHIKSLGHSVNTELQDYLTAEASTQNWSFVGPVVILLDADPKLRQGEVDISASMRSEDGDEPAYLGLRLRSADGAVRSSGSPDGSSPSGASIPSSAAQIPVPAPASVPAPIPAAVPAAATIAAGAKAAGIDDPSDRHSHRSAQASGWVLEDSGPRPRRHMIPKWGLMIGRSRYSEICVDHPEVSRQHAQIELRDDTISIEDLESTNGTFVNGKKIRGCDLQVGDKITVGPVTLTLRKG